MIKSHTKLAMQGGSSTLTITDCMLKTIKRVRNTVKDTLINATQENIEEKLHIYIHKVFTLYPLKNTKVIVDCLESGWHYFL